MLHERSSQVVKIINSELFDELLESITQVGEIIRDERVPRRKFLCKGGGSELGIDHEGRKVEILHPQESEKPQ